MNSGETSSLLTFQSEGSLAYVDCGESASAQQRVGQELVANILGQDGSRVDMGYETYYEARPTYNCEVAGVSEYSG